MNGNDVKATIQHGLAGLPVFPTAALSSDVLSDARSKRDWQQHHYGASHSGPPSRSCATTAGTTACDG